MNIVTEEQKAVREKIETAPINPGCYLFKDEYGVIIYVGKAKNLRNRVRQYFHKSSQNDEKGIVLVRKIRDVEFLVMPSEREALIREYLLIKEHSPWFNIQHKREQVQPYYIKIENRKPYPAILVTNEALDHTGTFLGSFRSRSSAEEVLFQMNRLWNIPSCEKTFAEKQRACLHYQTGHCVGTCGHHITADAYNQLCREIRLFFRGKNKKIFSEKKREMKKYIDELEFEKAARCKELLDQLEYLARRCHYTDGATENGEVLTWLRAFGESGCTIFYSSHGTVLYRQDFEGQPDRAGLEQFMNKIRREMKPDVEETRMFACIREITADKKHMYIKRAERLEEYLYEGSAGFTGIADERGIE